MFLHWLAVLAGMGREVHPVACWLKLLQFRFMSGNVVFPERQFVTWQDLRPGGEEATQYMRRRGIKWNELSVISPMPTWVRPWVCG